MSETSPVLPFLYTSGEPAGIGMDLILQWLSQRHAVPLVVLADQQMLKQRADQLGLVVEIQPVHLDDPHRISEFVPGICYCHHLPVAEAVQPGQLNDANRSYVLNQLQWASDLALSGSVAGIVTGPVHKAVLCADGHHFSGHTEFFADAAGVDQVIMMLATPSFRMALATTHLPLRAVPDAIQSESLNRLLRLLHQQMQQKFGLQNPLIRVAGLNPHAGEDGQLGDEEIRVIHPVIKACQADGLNVHGSYPADTLFTPRYLENTDVFLAMFHDQGLPVLKYAGFGHAVNITLGLPYIRTSVDHGTALDLAATGKASASSLTYAIEVAQQMRCSAW